MKTEKKLTPKERMEAEARIAALRAEANALSRTLKKDDEIGMPAEAPVEETLVEEAPEATEEVVEEAPVEEAPEATEEVVEEAPVEEVPEATEEVVEEAPVEEVPETTEEVVEEAPVEEVPETTEEVVEEAPVDAEAKRNWTPIWLGAIAILLAAIVALLIAMMVKSNEQPPVTDPDGEPPISGDVTPGTDDNVAFDMDAFVASTVNIANTLTTDEDVATNVDIFAEKIGADKLEELVGKYGELTVQKAIAEYLAFAPEIKMYQYINNNGLAYNPNAVDDYYMMLLEADNAYMEATGKNPNGALMSLEGYDIHKSNREAMKALIIESGDTALLTWYEAKTTGSDTMDEQRADTEAALAYKEEVKLELVNNVNGSVKLLELQLEQNVNGTNADTLKYTDVYAEFIINNYMYVVAN